ncbi:MAG: YciI family protein [Flavipsychrobacter sp.]
MIAARVGTNTCSPVFRHSSKQAKDNPADSMEKKYFALKLIPPRPTFSQDMTPDERAIMLQHVQYWRDFMAQGKVLAFGPVLDPAGTYGLGIVCVHDEAELQIMMANDPANGLNRYEHHPMLAVAPDK